MTTKCLPQIWSSSAAALAELGCKDPEGVKNEQEGIYEIDDAKCRMGTMDIKLDKDFSVILISRY